jgi:predicted metal-dependent HD superfamily phosphohydrolase
VTAPEAELRVVWRQLCGPLHEQIIEQLLVRYAEPHRRYHTATHVMWVLRHVDTLVRAGECADEVAPVVRAAALFHDVVYDATRHDNEELSGRWAARVLGEVGWSSHQCQAVAALVSATDRHHPSCTLPGAPVLFDADLAILGSSPAEYSASVTAIRQEYAHVDAAAWRSGRAEVLQGFLSRDPLFLTATMRAAREHVAKANLAAELASLR